MAQGFEKLSQKYNIGASPATGFGKLAQKYTQPKAAEAETFNNLGSDTDIINTLDLMQITPYATPGEATYKGEVSPWLQKHPVLNKYIFNPLRNMAKGYEETAPGKFNVRTSQSALGTIAATDVPKVSTGNKVADFIADQIGFAGGASMGGPNSLLKGMGAIGNLAETKLAPKLAGKLASDTGKRIVTGAVKGASEFGALSAGEGVAKGESYSDIALNTLAGIGTGAILQGLGPELIPAVGRVIARYKGKPVVADAIERDVAKDIGVDWDNLNDAQKAAIRKVVVGMQPESVQNGRLLQPGVNHQLVGMPYDPKIKAIPQGNLYPVNGVPKKVSGLKSNEIPIEERSFEDVSAKKVKAYQWEHPELKDSIQAEAARLLGELNQSIKRERFSSINADGQRVWTGMKKMVGPSIGRIMDNTKASYAEIDDALKRIINDNGTENIALAKKIELVIDDNLSRGAKSFEGYDIPIDESYIVLKNRILGQKKITPTLTRGRKDVRPEKEIPGEPLSFKKTIEVPRVYDKNAFIGKDTAMPAGFAPQIGENVEYSITINGKPDVAMGRIIEIRNDVAGEPIAVIESGLDFRGKMSKTTRPLSEIKQPFYLKPNAPGEPYAPFMPEYVPPQDNLNPLPTPESFAEQLRKEKGIVAAKSDSITMKPDEPLKDPNHSRKYSTPEGYSNWKMVGGDKDDAMPRPRNTQINDIYDELAKDLIGTSMNADSKVVEIAKDVKGNSIPIRYNMTDIFRNLRNAFGQHYDYIKKTYLDPFDKSKGDFAKAIRAETDDLFNNVVNKLGIKKGSQESAATMWYGEKKRMVKAKDPQTGKEMWTEAEYTLQDLQKEFPQTWEKIVEADKWFRAKYDAYVDRINEVLKFVYPYVEKEVSKLRDTKSSITDQRLRLMRDTVIPDYAKQGSLDILEKQIKDINQQIDDMLTNRRLPKRKEYYRHFRELGEGFKAFENLLGSSAQIDPRLVGLSETTQPKTRWASFMQHRGQGQYEADAVGGYLDYIKPANYKVFIEQHIPKFRQLAKDLADNTIESKNANDLIEHLQMFSNDLAGKTNEFDRPIQKTVFGRKAMGLISWVNGRVMSNAVLGNLRSLLAQPANIPMGMAMLKAPIQAGTAIKQMMESLSNPKAPIKKAFQESDFLSERYLDSVWSKFDEKILNQPKLFMAWALRSMDEISTKWIWATSYNKAKSQGVQNASKWADDFTRSIVAGRGIGEMPLLQKSKLAQLVIPFQVEVGNMWHIFGDAIKQKDYAGLALMPIALAIFNAGGRVTVGDDITFNPIGAVYDASKEEKKNVLTIAGRLGGEVLSNIPGGQYIAEAIPESARKKYLGRNDPTRFGTGGLVGGLTFARPLTSAANNLVKGQYDNAAVDLLTGYVMPAGGAQTKRIYQGAKALNILPTNLVGVPAEAGKTTSGTSIKFPIAPTFENKAKALAFGPFATNEGKKYSREGLKPLGVDQTQKFVKAQNLGVDPQVMYKVIMDMRALKPEGKNKGVTDSQRVKVIRGSSLTPEQQTLIIRLFINERPPQ